MMNGHSRYQTKESGGYKQCLFSPDWLTDGSGGLPGERQFISYDKGSTSNSKRMF